MDPNSVEKDSLGRVKVFDCFAETWRFVAPIDAIEQVSRGLATTDGSVSAQAKAARGIVEAAPSDGSTAPPPDPGKPNQETAPPPTRDDIARAFGAVKPPPHPPTASVSTASETPEPGDQEI